MPGLHEKTFYNLNQIVCQKIQETGEAALDVTVDIVKWSCPPTATPVPSTDAAFITCRRARREDRQHALAHQEDEEGETYGAGMLADN